MISDEAKKPSPNLVGSTGMYYLCYQLATFLNCGEVVEKEDRQEHSWRNHEDMLSQMMKEALYNPNELAVLFFSEVRE